MKLFALMAAMLIVLPGFNFVYASENEKLAIFVYDGDAFYSLIATPLSFHLGNVPVLLFKDDIKRQESFLKKYGANEFISIGGKIEGSKQFTGDAAEVSIEIAKQFYGKASKAVVIPYDNYSLSLIAVPIACYLNAPLLVYKNNSKEIEELFKELGIEEAIFIGNVAGDGIHLKKPEQIYDYIKSIKRIEYIAITNPNDVFMPSIIEKNHYEMNANIRNIKLIFFVPFDIFGKDEKIFSIEVPDGIEHIKINVSSSQGIIYAYLYDEQENLVTYSNSMACGEKYCYLDAISLNHSGNYKLVVRVFNGIEGGYFIPHGFSFTNAAIKVKIGMEKLSSPRYPLLHISKLAPLLACNHNGMVFAVKKDISFAYTTSMAGGAWNNRFLHASINSIVNETVEKLANFLNKTHAKYAAIVGDTNMIPMFYFPSPNNDSSVGFGIPSDMPYSLNYSLATGRIVAFDDIDASLLIARSIFYDELLSSWAKRFVFIFGEGFGETGGIFHQIPYSKVVRKLGFDVSLYGDARNDRRSLEKYNAFNAGYVEYEGHGDWFWMFANIYTNYYNNVDVAHVKKYEMNPSVVLTAACLMARLDGLPLNESIALAFIHAGAVAFIGATRETGKEAKLDWIEDAILKNDTTIGEAFILSKIKEEAPTKMARVLYGDPALNPWQP